MKAESSPGFAGRRTAITKIKKAAAGEDGAQGFQQV